VKRQTLGLLCGAVAALISPAAAQAAHAHASHATGSDGDARCLLLAMNMAVSQDQNARSVGVVAMAYYLGRLDAGSSHGDLEARMDSQVVAMKGQSVAPIAQGCGQTLTDRMKAVSAAGQQLQKKYAPPPSAPAAPPPLTLKPIPSPQSH
jgi:murein endopeptidase